MAGRTERNIGVIGFLVGLLSAVIVVGLAPQADAGGCTVWSGSGTGGNDSFSGSSSTSDFYSGLAGDDVIRGYGCPDDLNGNENVDRIFGGADDDDLGLGYGHDSQQNGGGLEAGNGDDYARGGDGGDTLLSGSSVSGDSDLFFGDAGNDFLNVSDNDNYDDAFGGSGAGDRCMVDVSSEADSACEDVDIF